MTGHGRGHAAMVMAMMLLALAGGACSKKQKGPKENTALFLTLNHVSLAGELSKQPDAELLRIGHQACKDMDKGMDSNQVVVDIGSSPEPGSARFNAYAYVAATASRELCPVHNKVFQGSLDSLQEDDDGN